MQLIDQETNLNIWGSVTPGTNLFLEMTHINNFVLKLPPELSGLDHDKISTDSPLKHGAPSPWRTTG
jgi:hypothetical protein